MSAALFLSHGGSLLLRERAGVGSNDDAAALELFRERERAAEAELIGALERWSARRELREAAERAAEYQAAHPWPPSQTNEPPAEQRTEHAEEHTEESAEDEAATTANGSATPQNTLRAIIDLAQHGIRVCVPGTAERSVFEAIQGAVYDYAQAQAAIASEARDLNESDRGS